jgi:hypothetical protein
MNIPFLDTTNHMVHGHEGWLEISSTQVGAGAHMEICFKWGHNMESHGLAKKEGLSAVVILPDREKQELRISRQEEDCYVFDFVPEAKGLYHFICINTGHYLLIARHRTPDGKAGLYYDTSMICTFLFSIEK